MLRTTDPVEENRNGLVSLLLRQLQITEHSSKVLARGRAHGVCDKRLPFLAVSATNTLTARVLGILIHLFSVVFHFMLARPLWFFFFMMYLFLFYMN